MNYNAYAEPLYYTQNIPDIYLSVRGNGRVRYVVLASTQTPILPRLIMLAGVRDSMPNLLMDKIDIVI